MYRCYLKGWNPVNRIHGDPRQFALEARNISSTKSSSSSSLALPSFASALRSTVSLPPAPPAEAASTEAQSNDGPESTSSDGNVLAGAAPGLSFSANDFNTVAGMLDAGLPHALRQEVLI
jgi:hypothetical protein